MSCDVSPKVRAGSGSQHSHSRANHKQEIWAPQSSVAWLGFLPGLQSGIPSLTPKASGLLAVTGDKELCFALQQTLKGWGECFSEDDFLEEAGTAAGTLVLRGGSCSS